MLEFSRSSDSKFWGDFMSEYWEKSPVLMSAGELVRPLTLNDVFVAVTNMPDVGPSDRFWMATAPEPKSQSDFRLLRLGMVGPQPSDATLEGFFRRMSGHSFGINIHRLEKGNPDFQALEDDISSALASADAPSPVKWRTDTFIGNYPATPFGIHRDPAGVLSFTLKGTRTYYTWPGEAFEEGHPDLDTPDPEAIARHLPDAERFDVGPGALMYWPSDRWHLVASPGEPFVVAQVTAYFRPEDVGQD